MHRIQSSLDQYSFFDNYRRAALRKWKQRKGSEATYKNLIEVFKHAHCLQYANIVRNICGELFTPNKSADLYSQ